MAKPFVRLTGDALDQVIQQSEQEAQVANQVGMHVLVGFLSWPADEVQQAYDFALEGEGKVVRNTLRSQGALWLGRLFDSGQLKEIADKRGIELR